MTITSTETFNILCDNTLVILFKKWKMNIVCTRTEDALFNT